MRRTRRRRRKSSSGDEVQLNMAAMLDMAFQLLAFFILTFRASPIEAQISLRLPTNAVTQTTSVQMGSQQQEVDDLTFPLTIDLFSLPDGELDKIVIGSRTLKSTDSPSTMNLFRAELLSLFEKPVFDSMIIRVGKDLHYESLMQVVDLSTKQKTSEGTPMSKISIVPLK